MTQSFTEAGPRITHTPCPKCGSEDAKYLNVIYEAGLSSINTETHYRSGPTTTTGTSQTASSQRAAPPNKKSYRWCLINFVIGAGLWMMDGRILSIPFLIASAYLGYTAFIFNSRVWPHRYQVWQQSAMCQRCGTIYVPNAAGITLESVSTKEVMAEHQRKVAAAAKPVLSRAQDLGSQVAQKAVRTAEEARANSQQREQSSDAQRASVRPDDENAGR